MTERAAIDAALAVVGLGGTIRSLRDLSGGCIHHVISVELEDHPPVVAKVNRSDQCAPFETEAASLRTLAATHTVFTPRPLTVGVFRDRAVLLMTELPHGRATDAAWRRMGEELAALHACDAGTRYGFESDNFLGATPQPNVWCDDWVEFNARHRIGYQVELARQRNLLTAPEIERLERLTNQLEHLLPRHPKPALLHGDLWSGNAMPTTDDQKGSRIAVIDPACSIGDGWADIAMMRLFGGFPTACLEAYAAEVTDHEQVEQRIAVYQLYHLLNHVNLFGRGYAGQVMAIVSRLGA